MKNNSKMVALLIVLIMIIIVGVTATVVSIYYVKDEIKNKGDINQEIASSEDLQVYVANSGDWSVEFPNDWYVSDDEKSDGAVIKNEPFSRKDSSPSSIRITRGESRIDQLIDDFYKDSNYEKKEVTVAGVTGTEIAGEVKEGEASMFPPGTKTRVYFFEIADNDVLTIQTDGNEYYDEIEMLVRSLRVNIQSTSKEDKGLSSVTVSESENIKVYKPQQSEKISSPYVLSGEAIAFEGTVNYRLIDANGSILDEGFMTAIGPDVGEYGDFNHPITFAPSSDTGTLEVFTISAKDGSEQDLVKIAVGL